MEIPEHVAKEVCVCVCVCVVYCDNSGINRTTFFQLPSTRSLISSGAREVATNGNGWATVGAAIAH